MSNSDQYRDKKVDDVAVSSSDDDDEDDDDDDDDDEEDEDGTDDPDQVEETSSITSSFDASPSNSRVKRAATVTDSGSPVHRQTSVENKKKWCWPPPSSPSRSSSLPTSPRLPPWAPLLRSQYMAAAANAAQTSQEGNSSAGAGAGTAQPADRHAKVFGHRLRLYCRTGYHLAIRPHGEVTGSSDPNDKYAVLELSSVKTGEVRIRGVAANRFLAMNRKGRLHGQIHKKENTVFVESMLGSYNTYLSRKYAHVGWYVAIRKNGKKKPAQKTRWGQKAIQFLPVRLSSA